MDDEPKKKKEVLKKGLVSERLLKQGITGHTHLSPVCVCVMCNRAYLTGMQCVMGVYVIINFVIDLTSLLRNTISIRSPCYTHSHTHTHTHTLTYIHTHTHTHTHTHAHTHIHTHAHIHTCTHTLTHAHTHAHTHTCLCFLAGLLQLLIGARDELGVSGMVQLVALEEPSCLLSHP